MTTLTLLVLLFLAPRLALPLWLLAFKMALLAIALLTGTQGEDDLLPRLKAEEILEAKDVNAPKLLQRQKGKDTEVIKLVFLFFLNDHTTHDHLSHVLISHTPLSH